MLRVTLLALIVGTPVLARDILVLESQLRKLDKQRENQALAGPMSACLLGAGDAEATVAYFTAAGWARTDDSEMGLISLVPSWGDPYVTLYDNGAICDVTSETLGLTIADQNLVPLLVAAQYPISSATVASGCTAYDLGNGVTAELSSSGNDPQCQSDTGSNVRFTFATP